MRIVLSSRFAMWMAWGPALTFFYNDAYAEDTLASKHPWALGRRADEIWAEIWEDIGPRIEQVLASDTATWDEALRLFLERSGYREETYHTFSYSPLSDDDGRTAGMLCVVVEETERVIGERRLATLRDLAARRRRRRRQPRRDPDERRRRLPRGGAALAAGRALIVVAPPGSNAARLLGLVALADIGEVRRSLAEALDRCSGREAG